MNHFSVTKKIILSRNTIIIINLLTIKGNFSTSLCTSHVRSFRFVSQRESQNPAVSLLSVYTSIADEKDTKLCVFTRFTRLFASVAKKYLDRNVLIARWCVWSNKETNRVVQRRVCSEQRSRANLFDIQNTNISGKLTHLLVKSRKFLAFFTARRNTCRIPRFPEDIVILSSRALLYCHILNLSAVF